MPHASARERGANVTQNEKKALQFVLELSDKGWPQMLKGKISESLRGNLAALHEAGAIGKVTMHEFDAICPPLIREFWAADIKRLREDLKFSLRLLPFVSGSKVKLAQPALPTRKYKQSFE